MVRKLVMVVVALIGLGGLFVASIFAVSETAGEVITLTTYDRAGAPHATRIWIVDDAGAQWLRSGVRGNGWYARLAARPDVEVVRAGKAARYRAVAVDTSEARDRIHQLMREKYGFGDRYISLLRDGSQSVAVRLDPM